MVSVVGDVVLTVRPRAFVALDRGSGRELWRRDTPDGYPKYWISGGSVVFVDDPRAGSGQVLFEVIEIVGGATVWQGSADKVTVFDKAVYTAECEQESGRSERCSTMRRDIRDGKPSWAVAASGSVSRSIIGQHGRLAPAEQAHLAFSVVSEPFGIDWTLLETATGAILPVRAKNRAWYEVAVGKTLIVTANDDVRGLGACPVLIEAFGGDSGTKDYSITVNSGRREDDDCEHSLGGDGFVGSGSRVAVVGDDGRAQLLDLAAGTAVWTSEVEGSALACDDRSLLITEHADQGALTLVDLATGRRQWQVTDPGFVGYPNERTVFVVGDSVVVGGRIDSKHGTTPVTIVYDRATGAETATYDGSLEGADPDWVAIVRYVDGHEVLEFHT